MEVQEARSVINVTIHGNVSMKYAYNVIKIVNT